MLLMYFGCVHERVCPEMELEKKFECAISDLNLEKKWPQNHPKCLALWMFVPPNFCVGARPRWGPEDSGTDGLGECKNSFHKAEK